jgi:regulator of replication initiation timing
MEEKNKPKKVVKNENFSFSRQEQEAIPQLLVDTHGNPVTEPAAISDPDSINDVVIHERSTKEETPCTEESTVRDELESVTRQSTSLINTDQQISEQSKVKELGTEIGILRQDLEYKSKENSVLQTQVEDLKSKLKSALDSDVSQKPDDRFFDVQFQVPSKDLRRHMDSSHGKIDSVPITAKVDLVTKSITSIQIGESDSQESTRTGEENSSLS